MAELTVEQQATASHALSGVCQRTHGPVDFADYVIVCGNYATACELTYSFERKLAKSDSTPFPADFGDTKTAVIVEK